MNTQNTQSDQNEEYTHLCQKAKEILTLMQICFMNMHTAKATNIIGSAGLTEENFQTIVENSNKRVQEIFDRFLDNDGKSPMPEIMTRINVALCEDFLNIKDSGKELEIEKEKNSELKQIITRLQFWARRYAEGRTSYVSKEINEVTEKAIKLGVSCDPETVDERIGSIWAYDGDPSCNSGPYYEEKYGKDGKSNKEND